MPETSRPRASGPATASPGAQKEGRGGAKRDYLGPHSNKRGFSNPHPMFLFWGLLPQPRWQGSQGLEGPHACGRAARSVQGSAALVLAGASRGFWKQLLGLPGLLRAMAPSLPKYSSSLAPFKCTPLADDSMRKCRTRSLLSSPASGTEDSVSTGTSTVVSPLPSPAHRCPPWGPIPGHSPELLLCVVSTVSAPVQGWGGQAQTPLPASLTQPEPCGFSACFSLTSFS